MIDYILTLIISFAGIILGGVLALIAPEELRKGEKYLKILEWTILAFIVLSIFYFSKFFLALAISLVLIVLKIFKKEYPALAFILLLSFFENFLFLAGSLVFIYGFPAGTIKAKEIIAAKKTKNKVKILLAIAKNNILYIIFGFILLPLLFAYS